MNTSTKTIDTEAIKQSIDLREYAGRFTTLHRESAHELAGPCPKCGGDDRFHCDADWFFCRQCHTKRGDIIEFITWKDGVSFKEAAATLTNTPLPAPATRRAPAHRQPTEQPKDWQRQAEAIAEQAHARLFDDNNEEAEIGRHYLEHVRKLEPHVWLSFKLGFAKDAPLPGTKGEQRAPAIVIPWYRDGKVVAMRFRFLQWHEYTDSEGKPRREKQTALTGSSFSGVFHGAQALEGNIAEFSTLLLIEGEVNGMSVWQVSSYSRLDVLSLGSESASMTPAMIEQAKQYATVMVFLDKAKRARAIQELLPAAYLIESPSGQDANDMLQAGTLGSFLALHRFQAAKSLHEQERLLWDLWDAARAWNGVDTDTKRMIAYIAKTLGKQVQLAEVRPGTWRIV